MSNISRRRVRVAQLSLLSLGLSVALQSFAQEAVGAAGGEAAKTLDAVHVHAEREGGYTVEQTRAATRLSLTPQDTPQSLTIVTEQRIQDQNLQSVRDVLDNVTGVSSTQYDTERVVFWARGSRSRTCPTTACRSPPASTAVPPMPAWTR